MSSVNREELERLLQDLEREEIEKETLLKKLGLKGDPLTGLVMATWGFFIGFAAVSLYGPVAKELCPDFYWDCWSPRRTSPVRCSEYPLPPGSTRWAVESRC